MNITDIQQMLMQQEGTGPYKNGRFFPYLDTAYRWTIGYGRNLSDKGLADHEAMMMLNSDIADAIEDVRHCFSCYESLSRPRQLCLISLAYNLGREGLSKFVRFIGAVHRGDWNDAADELMDSKAAKQAPVRYVGLAAMMRHNESPWA